VEMAKTFPFLMRGRQGCPVVQSGDLGDKSVISMLGFDRSWHTTCSMKVESHGRFAGWLLACDLRNLYNSFSAR
jgi:hypothetical protein